MLVNLQLQRNAQFTDRCIPYSGVVDRVAILRYDALAVSVTEVLIVFLT
jgi:hypothetical protein